MKCIVSGACFGPIEQSVVCAIEKGSRLPAKVFRPEYSGFAFLAFDTVFTRGFFNKVKALLAISGDAALFLSSIDPDPWEYFHRHFGSFGAITLTTEDTDAEYLRGLNVDPGGSPADALMHICNVLAVIPSGRRWAIVADREADLAVCAFMNASDRGAFLSCFQSLLLPDAVAAAKISVHMSSDENYAEFIRNYG